MHRITLAGRDDPLNQDRPTFFRQAKNGGLSLIFFRLEQSGRNGRSRSVSAELEHGVRHRRSHRRQADLTDAARLFTVTITLV